MAKILLVEDNDDNRDMLKRRLQRRGFEVIEAVDATGAIDKATNEAPDLILMDVELLPPPGQETGPDGWQTTRQLKANPATCRIPVIALTAHAMQEHADKSRAAGCDDHDTKPIELPRLLEKMTALLQRDVRS